MSYVRWSTPVRLPEGVSPTDYYFNSGQYPDIETSDFYIYDHVGGFVSVNIAGNRHKPGAPFAGQRGSDDWFAWLEQGREEIQHPDAGRSFDFEDMNDAIAKVEELIAVGFNAPEWLIDELRASNEDDEQP